jgi:hypothetical protein
MFRFLQLKEIHLLVLIHLCNLFLLRCQLFLVPIIDLMFKDFQVFLEIFRILSLDISNLHSELSQGNFHLL